MTTQVQIRGASEGTQEARTLVSRELDVNTTDKRISVHDGSTAGGVPHVNFADAQNQEFTYAAATGTDSIAVTLAIAPAAYAAGQKFCFKAASTNTGSATLNVNALGAKTIKKKDANTGTIVALSAGDIIGGGIYTAFYDGADVVLESVDSGGLQNVSQGDLNTSTGSVSTTAISFATLPGGEYGFYPTLQSGGDPGNPSETTARLFYANSPLAKSPASYIYLVGAGSKPMTAHQRYVSSSPPFDLGDGDVGGFMFLLMNKDGSVDSSYFADVPPWGYNGKTDISACAQCPITGKKFRKKPRTLDEVMRGEGETLEEITHTIKNADMADIPHPFANIKKGQRVVLLDPMDDKIARLIEHQNNGGAEEISEMVALGNIYTEATPLKRKSPVGVPVTPLLFK